MPFPLKFKNLLETVGDEVKLPKRAWITYVVCGVEESSCGWTGWHLESVFSEESEEFETILPTDSEQVCPVCGKNTFRTAASFRFELAQDQTPKQVAAVDYEVEPPEYK
jgi:hypothetical protein